MAQIINTNVPSLVAQRNLSKSSDAIATAIQRLSSGSKINSAKDDAAGLSIATRMTSQINGMNKAAQNANDGISLSQVAEGAMQSTSDLLQRMRDLSIQSANATNSSTDRKSLQAEVSQLVNEIDDVANNTQFNGQAIVNGSFANAVFQVGANANQTITFSIDSISASAIGSIASATGSAVSSSAATDITLAVGSGAATTVNSSANYAGTANGQDGTSAYAKAAAMKAANVIGLSVTASTSGTQTVGAVGGAAGNTYDLSINGVAIYSGLDVSTALSNSTMMDAINGVSSQTGVTASLSGGDMTLTASDGRNITVTESGTGFTAGTNGLSVTAGPFASVLRGDLQVSALDTIYIGGTAADVGLNSTITKDSAGINSIDISTQAGAQLAIQRIDSAISSISTNRSAMGALQNRFSGTIDNLQNVSNNTSAARSRIQDTDYAAEMASLTKNQILQQAGTAMLAQANSLPQSVLSLLG